MTTPEASIPVRVAPSGRLGSLGSDLLIYYATSAIVAIGLALGVGFLRPSEPRGHTFGYDGDVCSNWDGQWYKNIASSGYSYRRDDYSNVAFFPAFPLAGRSFSWLTGLRPELALTLVANLCLFAAMVLTRDYLSMTRPDAPPSYADSVLLSMALIPTSFFFRVAYTESMFLLLTILALRAIAGRWHLVLVAAIIGLATATKLVGIALIPALLIEIWRRYPRGRAFALRATFLTPLSCWGVGAYVAFLYLRFGEPLAFVLTQANWKRHPPVSPGVRLLGLATLEPIRSLYDVSSTAFWGLKESDFLFSLRAQDPVYFLAAAGLLAVGFARRWLSRSEAIVALLLLMIPYASIGYDQYMQSMARYSSTALPLYFVMGRLIGRINSSVLGAIGGLSGFMLGASAAMFAAWYSFY